METWVTCTVCHRRLSKVRDQGQVFWRHPQPADHEPQPMAESEAMRESDLVCDFCSQEDPAWEFPADPMEPVAGHRSVGGWLACNDCTPLIEERRWGDLTDRAMVAFEARHGPGAAAAALLSAEHVPRVRRPADGREGREELT